MQVRPIYRSDGEWMAVLHGNYLFDLTGDWIAWTHGNEVYSLVGEYIGYISRDSRILRSRVYEPRPQLEALERPAPFKLPANAPLPPLFASLDTSTVDVFEQTPDLYSLSLDRLADTGEEQYGRKILRIAPKPTDLLESSLPGPSRPATKEVSPFTTLDLGPPGVSDQAAAAGLAQIERDILNQMIADILSKIPVPEPPMPIEDLAAGRKPGASKSNSVASPQDRVRLAIQVVERMGQTPWAQQQGYCDSEGFSREQVAYVARCLLMPEKWIMQTPARLRKRAWALAKRFRVPEELVPIRLADLQLK